MLDRSEIDRLNKEGIPSPLPGVWWEFELDLGDHPESTLAKIRDVVRKVVRMTRLGPTTITGKLICPTG
jgi:hypothetical protein